MKKGILSLFFAFIVSMMVSPAYSFDFATYLLMPSDLPVAKRHMDLVNWKVGDYCNYDMSFGFFGNGKVHKKATKEEMVDGQKAIWVTTNAKLPIGNQKVETLFRRSDGKVLRNIVNGKEEKVEDPKLEIIEQRPIEKFQVKAGTFRVIYIKAKDLAQEADIEAWINPFNKIPLGGLAKTIVKKGPITVTMELTDFGGLNDLVFVDQLNHLSM